MMNRDSGHKSQTKQKSQSDWELKMLTTVAGAEDLGWASGSASFWNSGGERPWEDSGQRSCVWGQFGFWSHTD